MAASCCSWYQDAQDGTFNSVWSLRYAHSHGWPHNNEIEKVKISPQKNGRKKRDAR
jgi:hypothetical protein